MVGEKPARCAVPGCRTQEKSCMFTAPGSSHKLFRKWCNFVNLGGKREEKICRLHFREQDFIINSRRVVSRDAVPSLELSDADPYVKTDGVCCVSSCRTRSTNMLTAFPPAKQKRQIQRWRKALHLTNDTPNTWLRVCPRHFKSSDILTVKSLYLRDNAVPSIRVKRLVRCPRRQIRNLEDNEPEHLRDHNYYRSIFKPRSNRICSVYGCSQHAGNNIHLHNFPNKKDVRYKEWVKVLRYGKKIPVNAKVCSLHFVTANFIPGSHRLNRLAIPSQNLPRTSNKNGSDYPNFRPGFIDDSFHSSLSSTGDIYDSDAIKERDVLKVDFGKKTLTEDVNNNFRSALLEDCNATNDTPVVRKCGDTVQVAGPSKPYLPLTKHDQSSTELDTTCTVQVAGPSKPDLPLTKHDQSSTELDTTCTVQVAGPSKPDLPLTKHDQSSTELDTTCTVQVAGPSKPDLPLTKHDQSSTELNTTCEKNKIHLVLSDLLETNGDITTWTGVQSMELLQEICLAARKLESSVYSKSFKMHCTDRVILVLVKLKQNLTFAALGTLFRISAPTVGRYFEFTVQLLCQILERFVYMPPKEEIRQNIPLCFRGKFSNVTMILDCTEVPAPTLKCLNCRISTYSHYKSRRTVKFMVGVTPAGLISFYSDAYTGKASDKFIFNSENLIDRFEAHMDEIMVDKGFNIDNEVTAKGIKLHIPPRLKSNQLTPEEAGLNESIAKARVHVERIMQRIKIFSVLQDTIDTSVLGHIDDIIAIVCGLVNLSSPILRDDKF